MWIIVDIAHDYSDRRPVPPDCELIARGKEPTCIHESKERAEGELLRLQKERPEGEFVLFEAVERALPTQSRHDVLLVLPMPL